MLQWAEAETVNDPQHVVLWMHGLGADGYDFVGMVPELGLDRPVRFIFPHAPTRPITINGGMVMRAWYDIIVLEEVQRRADEAGLAASQQAVGELIEGQLSQGIASENLYVGGFSQGGAMAYFVGLTHAKKLGGIIALSAYLPADTWLTKQRHPANHATPVFAAHGRLDAVVPFSLGQAGAQQVKAWGHPVQWQEYPIGHTVSGSEIATLGQWLNQRMALTLSQSSS